MTKTYIMTVSHTGVTLYGGHLESNGSYTAFQALTLGTVQEFCAQDIPVAEKMDTKLGVIFSQAFSDAEKASILAQLQQNGYPSPQEYDLNVYLCNYIKGYPYVLILSADADILFANYYDKVNAQDIASIALEGMGKDPRIEVLAECIWKKLLAESGYLSKEKDFEEVKQEAQRFLQSGKSELDGTIYLEGESHDFFIRRRDAHIDNVLDYGGSHLLASLGNFVNQYHIDKDKTILMPTSSLAGNRYFQDVFRDFMSATEEIDEEKLLIVFSTLLNDLNEVKTIASSVGGGLPLSYIHEQASEDAIAFDLNFPEGAYAIEVSRDGTPIRTITETTFQDKGLTPEHTYEYRFVVVYKNEFGDETRTKATIKKVTTTSIQLPQPSALQIQETPEEATLTWQDTNRGDVKIYYSNQPFRIHANDVIENIQAFDYPSLASLGNTYQIQKDFSGERYFLPVTVIGNKGIAGEQQGIISIQAPKGVRVDATDINHVKVVWLWEGESTVRVKRRAENGNENWKDITNEGQEPELELSLPTQVRQFTISVSSVYQTADHQFMESAECTQEIVLASAKVNFIEAKSESRFFLHKDEYSLTLQADREPPCDLYVLIGEGTMPLDLTNFKSYLTIPRHDLTDGEQKKFTLVYHRLQKKQPLYFRIIAVDRRLPLKVVPETQKIN